MRGVRRWQEEESSEMKTPAALMEQVKSHPLDVDSDSEVWLAGAVHGDALCNASAYGHFEAGAQMAEAIPNKILLALGT